MAKKLRRVVLGEGDISFQAKTNAMKKYNSLTESQMLSLAGELAMAFWTEEFSLRMKEGETILGRITFNKGKDRLGWARMTKEDGQVLFNAEDWAQALGMSKNETDEALEKVSQECIYLEPDCYFAHPLAETSKIEGEVFLNMWLTATIMINIVRGVDKDGTPQKTEEALKHMLFKSNPLLNIDYLIAQVKTHHLPSIMKVCNAIANINFE